MDNEGELRELRNCVFCYVLSLTGNRDAAEDCAQEAFLRLWIYAQRSGIPPNPKAWLLLVAKRAAIDLARKQNVTMIGLEASPIVSECLASQEGAPQGNPANGLSMALRALTAEQQSLVVEHYYLRRTCAELAGRLGIPKSSVYRRIRSIKRTLRRQIILMERAGHV